MQALKNIVINGAMILVLLFGLSLSATAAQLSFEQVKTIAERGNSFYQERLGMYYKNGVGVQQDYGKAFEWYQKSADQGYAGGQYSVGSAYSSGRGVRQDHSKALEWFKKSAKQNDKYAQAAIGLKYEGGEGVRQNKTTAKEWYGKACDNGNQLGCDWYRELNEQGY